MIGLVIDGALILLAVIFMIRHARLGFVKSILNSIKAFVAIGIAYVFRMPVARLIDSMFMGGVANNWVYSSLMASKNGADPAFDLVSLYNDFPLAYNLLEKFGLDTTNLGEQLSSVEALSDEGITALSENIGGALSSLISTIIAVVVLFVVAIIALTVLISLLNVITRLPVIKFLNRVLGAAIGLVWAALSAWSIGMAITLISGFVPDVVSPDILTESVVLRFLSSIDMLNVFPGMS